MNSINVPKSDNEVFCLKTSTGRFIDCTENHNILTTDGFKALKEIKINDSIAIAQNWNIKNEGKYIPESKFIGWMIGNGCMYGYNVPSFITNDKIISDKFCEFINLKFGFLPKWHLHYQSKVYQWDITSSVAYPTHYNSVTKWLKENDLWGRKAKDKYIPEWFMKNANQQSVFELIQGLIETDGSITSGKRETIQYSTTSYFLAQQILYLLAKYGIIGHIDNGYFSKKATINCYKINVGSSEQKRKFRNLIKLDGHKGIKLANLKLTDKQSHFVDKLGRDTTEKIFDVLPYSIQIHGKRRLTKTKLREIMCKHLHEFEWLLSENIFWDPVESITKINEEKVFDRSVKNSNNYVVNGIIVHNSGSLENDADMVMFIYRPDYYDHPNAEEQLTDIIIAKGRDNPTGQRMLNYKPKQTLFEDTTHTKHDKL